MSSAVSTYFPIVTLFPKLLRAVGDFSRLLSISWEMWCEEEGNVKMGHNFGMGHMNDLQYVDTALNFSLQPQCNRYLVLCYEKAQRSLPERHITKIWTSSVAPVAPKVWVGEPDYPQNPQHWIFQDATRPLSVPFLFRTSGKDKTSWLV